MPHPPRLARRVVLAGLFALAAAPACADDERGDDERARGDLRAAVERGAVLPLAEVLARVRGKLPGRVIAVEVEREDGRFIYEFKVIDANGRRRDVHVDAADAAILKAED